MARTCRGVKAASTPRPAHGSQFGSKFEARVKGPRTDVVRCRVQCFKLNGKVERSFRTFKAWARLKLFAWFDDSKRIASRNPAVAGPPLACLLVGQTARASLKKARQ